MPVHSSLKRKDDGWRQLPCRLPPEVLERQHLRYDTTRFNFRRAMLQALTGDASEHPEGGEGCCLMQLLLAQSRAVPPNPAIIAPCLYKARVQARLPNCPMTKAANKQQQRAWKANAGWHCFCSVYERFIREWVLPQMGGVDLLYQAQPTLRIVLPGSVAPCKPHADADYYHDPNELNFWVSLTHVCGAASLWCESAPGAADFVPLESAYGCAVRFYGNRCRHFTVENCSGVARCSFDFRVVPAHLFHQSKEQYKGLEGTGRLGEGSFYKLMRADGHVGADTVTDTEVDHEV